MQQYSLSFVLEITNGIAISLIHRQFNISTIFFSIPHENGSFNKDRDIFHDRHESSTSVDIILQ